MAILTQSLDREGEIHRFRKIRRWKSLLLNAFIQKVQKHYDKLKIFLSIRVFHLNISHEE